MAYRVCGHCDRSLGEKTYKEHKRNYFHDGEWITSEDLATKAPSSVESSEIGSFEP